MLKSYCRVTHVTSGLINCVLRDFQCHIVNRSFCFILLYVFVVIKRFSLKRSYCTRVRSALISILETSHVVFMAVHTTIYSYAQSEYGRGYVLWIVDGIRNESIYISLYVCGSVPVANPAHDRGRTIETVDSSLRVNENRLELAVCDEAKVVCYYCVLRSYTRAPHTALY